MNWLYLILDLGTLACPLILSFENKVYYFGKWKNALIASFIIAVPFLVWDIIFTANGIWGFNPDYNLGITLFNLPFEEILFFIIVPFACTFIYEVCRYYFRNKKLKLFNKIFSFLIPLYSFILIISGDVGTYTISVQISSMIVLVWLLLNPSLKYIGVAFLFTLLPFLVMNGILTGCCIAEPVVWYSELHKIEPRIFTIPYEDILYSFTLTTSNVLVYEWLNRKQNRI